MDNKARDITRTMQVSVGLTEAGVLGGDNENTPTEIRINAGHEDAIEAADGAPALHELGQDICEDIDDELFRNIDRCVPDGYNWSENYNKITSTALPRYVKAFYDNLVSTTIQNEVGQQHLKLLNEELHCPENATTDAQKFLIYHYLYWQWRLYQYRNGIIVNLLPMQTIYVEGLPGTGKTFIINTLHNIVEIIYHSNDADAASGPTGCAAALIDGSTHTRMMKIPVRRESLKAPSSIMTTNSNQLKYLQDKFRSLIAILMDEHSMMGCNGWGWARAWNEQLRQPCPAVMDKEHNKVVINDVDDSFNLDEEVHMRQWGGIPLYYSLGDTNQLAPVAKRASYDHRQPNPGADQLGKIVFYDSLHTTDPHEPMATIVLMDDVVRQTDTRFKDLLQNMRQGQMNDNGTNLIVGRVLNNSISNLKDCI